MTTRNFSRACEQGAIEANCAALARLRPNVRADRESETARYPTGRRRRGAGEFDPRVGPPRGYRRLGKFAAAYARRKNGNGMLAELVERYGSGAIVRVTPYPLDADYENTRWIVEIDGGDDPEVDVRLRHDGDLRVLVLVTGEEEIELYRWNPTLPNAALREPAAMIMTLGELSRNRAR